MLKNVLSSYCDAASDQFNATFRSVRGDRIFKVTACSDGHWLSVQVLLSNPKETFYYPVQAKLMCHSSLDDQLVSPFSILLKACKSYYEEFLQGDEEVYLPIDWAPYGIDDHEIFMRGQIQNLALEKEADRWLEGHRDLLQ